MEPDVVVEGEGGTYDVHLFAVVRIKITGVQAASQIEAITQVEDAVPYDALLNSGDLCRSLRGGIGVVRYIEWAEELTGALVDERGDTEFERSRGYHPGKDGWEVDKLILDPTCAQAE
jgi:hypothetical protein